MTSRYGVLVAVFATILVGSGCGGGGAPTTPPPPPPPAPVATVTVALSAGSAIVGLTVQATATTKDAAGNQLQGRSIVWSSAASGIASVSVTGLVTAVSPGTAQITATSEGVTGGQSFIAQSTAAGSVATITLTIDSNSIYIGDTLRLVAIPRNAAGQPVAGVQLVWSSSDTGVATVSASGLVTALAFGDATIDFSVAGGSLGGSSAGPQSSFPALRNKYTVHTTPVVVISPPTREMDVNGTTQYTARMTNKTGSQLTIPTLSIAWQSSDPSVATINASGLVTANSPGLTTISARPVTTVKTDFVATSFPLKVTVCGGLLDTSSWFATLSTTYNVSLNLLTSADSLLFTIDQSSSGTALLANQVQDNSANRRSTTWTGSVSGFVHVNDRAVQKSPDPQGHWAAIGTTTDIGDTPQTAISKVQLTANWSVGSGCTISMFFLDWASWRHQNTPDDGGSYTAISASMEAADRKVPTGPKPAGGWTFDRTVNPSAFYNDFEVVFPDDLAPLIPDRYYYPLTPVSRSMLLLTPGFSFGTGQFKYMLTPR